MNFRRALRSLASHRLTHFFAFGGLLFAAAQARGVDPNAIELSHSHLERERAELGRRLGLRTAIESDARAVEQRLVEDAILVREAERLGLRDSDPIVRERLVQKMLQLAEDVGGASREPTEAELRTFFEGARDRFKVPETLRLVHVVAESSAQAESLAPTVVEWSRSHDEAEVPPFGEPFAVSRQVGATREVLAVQYGATFADAVSALPLGRWSRPVQSKFGWHLVRVIEHSPEQLATFEQAREDVRLAYAVHARQEAIAAYLTRAMKRYRVRVDGKPLASLQLSGRTARRVEASLED